MQQSARRIEPPPSRFAPGAGRLPPWSSGTNSVVGSGSLPPVWHDARVEEPLTCSAKGCTAPAAWAVLWNNPRLHTPERRKTWLACEEHRESLSNFLAA